MTKKENNIKAIIAICSVAFLNLVSSATSPALAVIGQNFPEASAEAIASIATLNTLASVPFTIIAGLVLGRWIKFRPLTFIGLLFTLVGGLLPYFATEIGEILVGRAILGVGTGILAPIITTITLSIFKGDDVSKQFSRNSMATNTGAIIFQLLGGFLCNYDWKLPFAVYIIVVPVILIVYFWFPEPQKEQAAATGLQNVKKFDIRKIITGHVLFWSFEYAIYMMWFYGYVTQTSGIIIRNGYGDSTVAAIVLSLFTLLGVVGGYCFPKVQRRFGTRTMAIGFSIIAISFVSLAFSSNIWSYILFSCTFGFGYGLLNPANNYFLGIGLDKDYRAASISVSTIISSLGSFSSAYAIKYSKILLHSDWERLPFLVGACFFAALCILFIFFKDRAVEAARKNLTEKQ